MYKRLIRDIQAEELLVSSRWMEDREFCNQIPHFTMEVHMKF